MSILFQQESDGILRLDVPFERIATSVFLLLTQEGPVLYDCATTPQDVKNVVIPALSCAGIDLGQLRAVVCSHAHADHCGGLAGILNCAPSAPVIALSPESYKGDVYVPQDGECLFGRVKAIHLPGHTSDCLGLYDLRTSTLLSGDALQLQGIDRFGCAVSQPTSYRKTVEKIRCIQPHLLLASHDYVPLGARAEGQSEVERYLDVCVEVLQEIHDFVCVNRGSRDADTIAALFRESHPCWPLLPTMTVRGML